MRNAKKAVAADGKGGMSRLGFHSLASGEVTLFEWVLVLLCLQEMAVLHFDTVDLNARFGEGCGLPDGKTDAGKCSRQTRVFSGRATEWNYRMKH